MTAIDPRHESNQDKPMEPTVRNIVELWLRCNGFDGLFNEDAECACSVDALEQCGAMSADCIAGYRINGCTCDKECDFHIVSVSEWNE